MKLPDWLKASWKKPPFVIMVGVVVAVIVMVVSSIITAANSGPRPWELTDPAQKVTYAVTANDPQNVEGVEFVPLSRVNALLVGPAAVSDAAINPETSVVALAVGDSVFMANYAAGAESDLLAALDAKGATVSVNPSGVRTAPTTAVPEPFAAVGASDAASGAVPAPSVESGALGNVGGIGSGDASVAMLDEMEAAAAAKDPNPPLATDVVTNENADLYAPTLPTAPSGGGGFAGIFNILLILGVMGFLFFILRKMMAQQFGGGLGGPGGKQEVEGIDSASRPRTKFSDVAGADEAIEDMEELVDFLRDPNRYADLGAKVPHGALLVGPPGTGKTLLARALAGETGATFIPVSGSDFVEMYVGVGAKRVRGLFSNARKAAENAPVIIFIDEIDAVGRSRSNSQGGNANQEQEATLNALLVELDGFSPRDNIIIIGATNRPDMLDDALLRPGRLERQIHVPLPNRIGREAILGIHLADKPVAADVNLEVVARRTMGFSGAELASLANEAALICVREGRLEVTERDLSHATETVAMGKVRKSAIITEDDRKITAWHEAGHAVCGLVQPDGSDVVSISLLPRGQSGGQTWFADDDMAFLTRRAAYARLVTGLGGMAAEQMLFGDDEYTTGPSGDLQQCTNTALAMVAQYGMGDDLLVKDGNLLAAGSGVTDRVVDEAERLLKHALVDAKQLLADNRVFFDRLVAALLDRDTLTASEIEELKAGHDLVAPTPPPAPKRVKGIPDVPDVDGGTTVVLDPFGPEPRRRGRIGRLIGAVSAAWSDPQVGSRF